MATKDTPAIVHGEPRHAWLDWLRAISILLVLGTHYQVNWNDAGFLKPLAMFNMRIGWSGVDFFFVISGFLIGNLLLGEILKYGRLEAQRFYVRRLLKIWPLYYLTCLLYLATAPALFGLTAPEALSRILPALFHVQNYVEPGAMGHLWSLAVEEHFYLLLPMVITGCLHWSAPDRFARNLLVLLCAGLVTVAALRWTVSIAENLGGSQVRVFSHFRMDTLFLGVVLAWGYRYRPQIWRQACSCNRLLWLPLVAGGIAFAFNPNRSVITASAGYSLIAAAYAAILVAASRFEFIATPPRMARLLRALAWIGRYCYPIYLFHPFLWEVMAKQLHYPERVAAQAGSLTRGLYWMAGYLGFVGASILVGAAVAILLERPLLRLRNALVPSRTLAFDGGSPDLISDNPDAQRAAGSLAPRAAQSVQTPRKA